MNQYTELLKLQGWEAQFTLGAVEQIASEAVHRGVGARGLRTIMEAVLLDVMYRRDGDGRELFIDEQMVASQLAQGFIEGQTEDQWLRRKERPWLGSARIR